MPIHVARSCLVVAQRRTAIVQKSGRKVINTQLPVNLGHDGGRRNSELHYGCTMVHITDSVMCRQVYQEAIVARLSVLCSSGVIIGHSETLNPRRYWALHSIPGAKFVLLSPGQVELGFYFRRPGRLVQARFVI